MKKVLIVEDDIRIGSLIKDYFTKSGFEVEHRLDGVEGFLAFRASNFDLLILDLMLPGIDGFEIAKRVREESQVPIIMVTARGDDEDQIKGYGYKIDDYVTKPFNPELLVIKAKRLLERCLKPSVEERDDLLNIAGLEIDQLKHKVYVNHKEIILEPKQFEILIYLIVNKNKVVSRQELLNKIWGYDYFGNERVIDTQIRKLRKQLEHKAYLIKTIFSVGYSFEEE